MTGTDTPLFTVAIPVYNRADLIGETIESVFAQTFTDYEIVAVNDGSKDDSLAALRQYEPRIRVIDQENKGLAGARNTGAANARGRYVIFLDSDDLFFPWSLQVLADAIDAWKAENGGEDPALVSGEFVPFTEMDELGRYEAEPTRVRSFPDYLQTRARATGIAPSGTAVRTDVYERTGASDDVRVMFEDVDIWFKAGTEPGYAHADAPPVAAYRVGHASMMGNMKKQLDGFDWIAGKVRDGRYPDRGARRREMEEALAKHGKGCAFRAIHCKDRARGWGFYRRIASWQARAGDWKFVISYPLLLAAGVAPTSPSMRRNAKQTISDE